jgi:hypothetical protein
MGIDGGGCCTGDETLGVIEIEEFTLWLLGLGLNIRCIVIQVRKNGILDINLGLIGFIIIVESFREQ